MCRSVYFAEVGGQADDLGPRLGELDQRVAERRGLGALPGGGDRGDHRRGRQARACRLAAAGVSYLERITAVLPLVEDRQRLLPFVRLDAQEVVALALPPGTARPCPCVVSQMMTRGCGSRGVRGRRRRPRPARRCRCRRPAARTSRTPSNFGGQRLEVRAPRVDGAVGLLVVDVDDADQVVELEVPGRHRGLPGRALVAARRPRTGCRRSCPSFLRFSPSAMPTAIAKPVAQRAAGDLHARRVGWPCPTSAGGCRPTP